MTAQVVPIKPQSVAAMITHTKAAWDRADAKRDDADDWMLRTGKLLVELKAKVKEEGGRWLDVVKKLGRSARRASDLMRLAEGKDTVEKQREGRRKSMKKTRAKKKSAQRGADKRGAADTLDWDNDGPNDFPGGAYAPEHTEKRWQRSFHNFVVGSADLCAQQAYWDKNFPDWQQYKIPSHLIAVVREAATEFAALAATVAKMGDRK
jgi:hypothetical protein